MSEEKAVWVRIDYDNHAQAVSKTRERLRHLFSAFGISWVTVKQEKM